MPDLEHLFNQAYHKGRALMDVNRFEAAIDEFNARLAEEPEDAFLMLLIGQCNYELKRFSDAESSLTMSVNTNPDDPYAHYMLGMVLMNRGGNMKRAKQCFDTALALAPEGGYFLLGQANYYIATEDYPTAEKYINRALAIEPALLKALQLKAMVLAQRGETDQAARVVEEALHLAPENSDTLRIAAYTSDLRGDLKAAAGFQEESLRLAPDRQQAQRFLQAQAKAAIRTSTSPLGSWIVMGVGLLAMVPLIALASKIASPWFDWLLIGLCGVMILRALLPFVYVAVASKKSYGKVMVFENWHQARDLVHTVGGFACYLAYLYTKEDFLFSAAGFLFAYGLVGLALQVVAQKLFVRIGYIFLSVAYLLAFINCVLNFTPAGSSRLISQALFIGLLAFFVTLGLMLPSDKKK